MQIYVNRKYTRSGNGSKEYPFRNISEAAAVASPEAATAQRNIPSGISPKPPRSPARAMKFW